MKQQTQSQTHNETPVRTIPSRYAIVEASTRAGDLAGLFVAGEVTGCRRTSYTQKGGDAVRYSLSITLLAATGRLVVERWSDNPSPPDLPAVGEHVCIPVTLQHFNTKNGVATRLCWGSTERGEEF